ncbi:DUF1553 domain-containing protein [Lignipirellula cremea]|uniref:Xanthan lyase n=1 Tax=Lignipirellula cremea TaxID=2528010 RepID=A0A518E4U7_9BACT|nr:DUF1553 domain-containing protein [Lignipirellula cremea]QDU99098.1 Xanthan lyase precursor [Lignipirellula cremea]
MHRYSLLLLAGGLWTSFLGGVLAPRLQAGEAEQRAFFEARIRPVLIQHCNECHAADSKEIKGGLRVDSAAGLLTGGDSGPAVIAGKPDESPLMEALRYEGVEMPPAGRLSDKVIADFETWITQGAFDPRTDAPELAASSTGRTIDMEVERQFWSFQPPQAVPPPVLKDNWSETEVDRYVFARLQAAGLSPAPDADRRTLVRRLYFDLIGLPPTPEEVEAFVQDDSPEAWPKLVDRLLQSDQFGVHWGRHWLDVARYADSNGGDFNATFHNAWKYRDYVIASMNQDKPYDQFVREQLAGDLLPAESDAQRSEQIVATGFLMLGAKMLSERDKLKLTMDVVDEQLNTVGQTFMALTLGCARCHDHKFDPIPTKDYYAMAGIFRSTRTLQGESQQYVSTWPRRVLPTDAARVAAVEAFEAEQKSLQARIKATQLTVKQEEARLAKLKAGEQTLVFDDADARKIGDWKASTYSPTFVGKGYLHDDQSGKGEKSVEFTLNVPRTALYDVQCSYTPAGTRASNVPVSIVHADGQIEVVLDQTRKPTADELFASVGQFSFTKGTPGLLTISNAGTRGHVIVDAVRLVELDQDGKPVQAELDAQDPALVQAIAAVDLATSQLEEQEQALKDLLASAPAPLPQAIAVDEAKAIADCEICIRGEHLNQGPVAPRGVLQAATYGEPPTFNDQQSGRLELAQWLASPTHPLTARVYVNRLWHHLFGQGLVATVDNFGQLGDRPSHPLLLDRLALDFIDSGWSTKAALRQMALSRTYRMSNQYDDTAWNLDPENHLLWRAHSRRLPAEAIRDSMLAVSGQLDLSPGGSPVEGLGVLVTQNVADEKAFVGKPSQHRSTYMPIIRSQIPAILAVFDFADPDLVTGRRAVTNVPAQALLLLNSPFVMEQAAAVEARLTAEESFRTADRRTQIEGIYQAVLSRPPTAAEIDRAEEYLTAAAEFIADDKANGEKTKAEPPSPLAQLIHTLFASTEFRLLN